jgi:hypothetical protein
MDTFDQVYLSLQNAAERIAGNGYGRMVRKGKRIVGFEPSAAHRAVVDMLNAWSRHAVTADEAMGLLWRSDVWAERFNVKGAPTV